MAVEVSHAQDWLDEFRYVKAMNGRRGTLRIVMVRFVAERSVVAGKARSVQVMNGLSGSGRSGIVRIGIAVFGLARQVRILKGVIGDELHIQKWF